jgi:Ca2+-binding RTX toxin-like protein
VADPADDTTAGAVGLGALPLGGTKIISGTVQSYTSTSFGGKTATVATKDPVDYYRIDPIASGITEVALRPAGITFPSSKFNQGGVSGVVQHLEYRPSGALGGQPVIIELRVGYARLGSSFDSVWSNLGALFTTLNANPNDASLARDRAYYGQLNGLIGQLMERNQVNVDASVAARIEASAQSIAATVASGLKYSSTLKSIALGIASLADQWTTPAYYVNVGGTLVSASFGDLTSSYAWTAAPGAGFVGVSGYEAVARTSTQLSTLPTYRLDPISYAQSDVHVLTQTEPRTVVGNSSANTLTGRDGNDLLIAGAGADVLNGGKGSDRMVGGDGNDTYYVSETGDTITETSASTGGIDRVWAAIDYTLPNYVENASLLNGAYNLTGNALANSLVGNSAPNSLIGGAGNDTLSGGDNKDSGLKFGSGSVVHTNQNDGFPVHVGYGMSLGSNANIVNSTTVPHVTVHFVGTGAPAASVTFTVNNVGAVITLDVDGARGFIDPNGINPASGFDSKVELFNGSGALVASNDDRQEFVNNVNAPDPGSNSLEDSYLVYVVTTPGTYTARVSNYFGGAIPAGWHYDMHVSVAGELGLYETLTGGAGKDRLIGGHGKDFFDFNSISESGPTAAARDVISDFVKGEDRIDLATIDANTLDSENSVFIFQGTAAFNGVAGRLRYFTENPTGDAGDKTIVEGDVNGDKKADFQIELTGLFSLAAGDFVL